jgi:hypothetical protein
LASETSLELASFVVEDFKLRPACATMRESAQRGFQRLSNRRQWTASTQQLWPTLGRRRITIQATPSTDSSTIVLDGKSASVSSPGNQTSYLLAILNVLIVHTQTPRLKSLAPHTPSSPSPSHPRKTCTPAAAPSWAFPPLAIRPAQFPPSVSSRLFAVSSSAFPSCTKRLPLHLTSPPSSPPNHC